MSEIAPPQPKEAPRPQEADDAAHAYTLEVEVYGRRVEIPGSRTREVIRVPFLTRIPSEEPDNLGVILHAGALLTVLDLGPRLKVPVSVPDGPLLCIIVREVSGLVAIRVDTVVGLVRPKGERQGAPGKASPGA